MVGGRVIHAEEVVKDGPDVVLTMTRLALSDVQDHNSSRLPARRRRLHRERN